MSSKSRLAACSFGKKVLHSVLRATSGPLVPSLHGKPHCKHSDTVALPSWLVMSCTYKRCSPRLNHPSAVPHERYNAAMAKKGGAGATICVYFSARCALQGSWRWVTLVLIRGHHANCIATPSSMTTTPGNGTQALSWGEEHQEEEWNTKKGTADRTVRLPYSP